MSNSLASVHPELISEWSEKNLPLTPDKITFGSNKRVWWKGACGHEWETSVKARSKGEKCPICSGARVIEGINDLATLKPLLAQEWSEKNELKPTEVSVASHKKIIWKCKHGHEWEASVKSRTVNGTGCPYCSHNKVLAGFNDLASQYPDIAAEWSDRNLPLLPTMVTAFANSKAWWKCKNCGNEWHTLISTRSGGSRCPYCSGYTLLKGFNDLATTHPDLAAEWSERNHPLLPDEVNAKSRRNVWWKCKTCGNEWKSVINARVKGTVCPVCADRAVLEGYNDLATTDRKLLAEWDYEKNSLLPTQVSRKSMKSVWWKCSLGHSWKAKISDRTILREKCTVCESEYRSVFPGLAVAYYANQKGLKVQLGSDKLLGIPLETYIPSEKLAIEFTSGSEQMEVLKSHLCKQRNIKLVKLPFKTTETEAEYSDRVKAVFKSVHVDFWKLAQNQNNKTFAIIIDEAHSSTSGKDMIAVKNTLGQNDGPEEADAQDAIENEIQRHGKAPNVSVFAFTATPKPMTLRLFGRESIDADGHPVYQPFHLYSMKQAIEEGYILDVLQNYIEYKTYYKLNKTIEDDPEMKTIAAKRQIARYIDLFDDNINQRVNIIVEHFRSTVMQELGGQAKAMVITASREAAVKYRQAFEDYVTRHNYKDVKALVAFSGKVKIENTEYTEPSMNGFAEDKLPKVFDGDEYNVLLVANKYQVGFDQPKLCAMYVLKKLRGVNAVQTLSRLNRVCPPFDKKVVVMDFVNHAEEMEDAFAPFYTTTVLSNTATIAQLRELENKIDGYNVLDDRDVDTVASIVYNPKGKRTTAKEDRLVYQCIQRAVNVLKNQFNEDHQRAFTKNCRGFVRLYEFLSMASSFGDPELHKKYVFVNLLLTYLVVGNSGGISLKDKIQATNFVQESQGDKGNKQRHASAPNVKLSGADVGLTVDEVKHLSEIIDEVNSRAGKGYDSSAMTKVMLQIKDLLLHSDKLKTAAKNNTEQDFEFSFYDNTDDALIEGLSQNQDFFSLLLSNDDIKHRVLGVFLHEVYKELREQP